MYTVFACLSHSLISANTTAFSGACKDTSTMEDGEPPPRPEQVSKKASEQQASNICHDQGREEEPTYIPAIWTITLCANVRYFGGAFAPLYCADADSIASKHSESSLGERGECVMTAKAANVMAATRQGTPYHRKHNRI